MSSTGSTSARRSMRKDLSGRMRKASDPSRRGLFNYKNAEYRDTAGTLVPETEAKDKQARIWIYQDDNAAMPASKQAESTRDPNHRNWRFYDPPHPVTGKPCPHPKSGWKFAYNDDADSPDKRSFVSLDRDHRIAWGRDKKSASYQADAPRGRDEHRQERFPRLLRWRKADVSDVREIWAISRSKARGLCLAIHSARSKAGQHYRRLLWRNGQHSPRSNHAQPW